MSKLVENAKNYVSEKVANMKKPEASLTGLGLHGVSREGVEYDAKVSVDNPYKHPIPICEISYILKSDGRFDHFSLIIFLLISSFSFSYSSSFDLN